MRCPKCKDKTEVLQTWPGEVTKRRRRCLNPSCLHRFTTRESTGNTAPADITTESVMASLNLKKRRGSQFDVEAIAAAIAVDKRKAALRRAQREAERSEWSEGYDLVDPAPARLDRRGLRRELEGY